LASNGGHEHGARRDELAIAALAAVASVAVFTWYFLHNQILLYGDAVAHLNNARRVFDSREAGLLQLGTVWLPLPHVLSMPFVANDWMWRTGLGGSIVSMIAYVIGCFGVFRLVRGRAPSAAAWAGALIYGLNPNLLYMQSTAMTEPLFLAEMVWALVYLDDLLRGLYPDTRGALPRLAPHVALGRCGVALAAAILTRYDGWLLALLVGVIATLVVLRGTIRSTIRIPRLKRTLVEFLLLCALCPTLWLTDNYAMSKHPLDWMNGPYSAKAIEQRRVEAGSPPYPGQGNMRVAAMVFLKCVRMNSAEGAAEKPVFALALIGTALALLRLRRMGVLLLLWFPLVFYSYSIAFGSVPIYLPDWWPWSYYNVRFGLELLPMFAVSAGLLIGEVSYLKPTWLGRGLSAAAVVVLAWGYAGCWRGDSHYQWGTLAPYKAPLCLREAEVNGRSRMQMEEQLAPLLRSLPRDSTILISAGQHVGALEMAGLPLHRAVTDYLKIPWSAGLSSPASVADYVVAFDGDAVAQAVAQHPQGLSRVAEIRVPGTAPATVYVNQRREDH